MPASLAFGEIQDSGRYDMEPLAREKAAAEAGQPLAETLVLRLGSGEQIYIRLNPRSDGISERLTIAMLVDRRSKQSGMGQAAAQGR